MNTQKNEMEILQKALKVFEKTTNLRAEVERHEYRFAPKRIGDATIRIAGGDMEWRFLAEVRNTLTPANLGAVLNQLYTYPGKGLIITKYVTPQMAERLKEMEVPFIDTAGNAYFNEPPVLIFIKGNRLAIPYGRDRRTRAFQPTGLQLVFALLCNPGLEDTPYRKIAEVANVALGTIGWVLRDLKQKGYLVDRGKRGRQLVQKKTLANRWAEVYPERLRPKLLVGRYRTANHNWWKDFKIQKYKGLWGGEVAAGYLTKYLKPEIITIYTDHPPGELLLKNRLKKDPLGDVEILKTFWTFKDQENDPELRQNFVHPLLIFADLLATGNPRNIETAEILYEQHLIRLIGQD